MMSHYPAQTRYVKRACQALGLSFSDLDNGEGYLFAVSNGRHSFVSGSGAICTWPLNAAHAFAISRDKQHTHAVLKSAGIATIPSELFFLHADKAKLRAPGRERADALDAFARMKRPVFCKPNQGSRGDFAEIVADLPAFKDYIARVAERYDAILLQPVTDGTEYRVFCLDGEAIFAARKADFALVGDGVRSLEQLLHDENARLAGIGVSSTNVKGTLAAIDARHGLGGRHILRAGETLILSGRRTLSAGGDVAELTTAIATGLAKPARNAADALGLRVAGVDIFDVSPARDLSELVVIEVNGNPGIQSLEAVGHDALIDQIWQSVLTRYFAECRR